jgi:hypothetical protein
LSSPLCSSRDRLVVSFQEVIGQVADPHRKIARH